MNETDRFFERQRQNWLSLRRLGVKNARCLECPETSPHCFLGDVRSLDRDGNTLVALCERCKRRAAAPTDPSAIERQWEVLRKKGCRNSRCYCGEENPFCMEADHIAGRQSSDDVMAVCINCHLKRTRRQLTEWPPDDLNPKHPIIVERNRLRGTIEHFELAVVNLRIVEEFLHNMACTDFDHMQD